ncbi:cd7 antigen-like isoform X2 [Mastacembelus armatus]|uniref:cd7 antigen-like isoform X2 n=1 Tax=Mastacembelus armatus TaxID=205130 RepID=UPI000E45EB25|nr:uncharacterized protein LOC113127792 isoform X2 [Mastacembelus armatus]
MPVIQWLAFLCTLFIIHTRLVHSDIQFLEAYEGESVVLPCVTEQRSSSPFGVYLKRKWLQPGEVLFMYTKEKITVNNKDDKNRISVTGDPSSHCLNVTISQLRLRDTDHYYCEFLVDKPSSQDEHILGKTEFFILVKPGPANIELVETCVGGSVVFPCPVQHEEGLVVVGVSLKRQRGQSPVEVLYNSRLHHASSSSFSSSQFPVERVQLSLVPGPGSITYNLTLQQLQPEDSALYSCQMLIHGRPDSITSLGRRVFFVSVQGNNCGCSNYSVLLYVLSSAVATLLLVLIGLVVCCQAKTRHRVNSQPQAPIYEEMVGVRPRNQKLAPHHLEETQSSQYRNVLVKKSCSENHYESPSGVPCLRTESHK